MTAYYVMLSGLSLCGACLCIKNRSRLKDGIFLIISFAVMAGMSAIRYDLGVDYSYIYTPLYKEFIADPANVPWEPGFKLLLSVIHSVTESYQALFVVTSLIIIALVMAYFWFHSPNPLISVLLFIMLSHYYCSMNFIRQMLAAAITMFAFPLLKKRTPLNIAGYFAIVLIAASFHKSALILIPFFFINLIQVNKYVLAAYTAVTVAVYFLADKIIVFVTRHWYSQYGLDNIHMEATFSPVFTIAVAVVFLIIFLGARALKERDSRNCLYVNYGFFTVFFVLMGTRFSVLDRLSMYFSLLAPVAIAIIVQWLAERYREERSLPSRHKHSVVLMALLLTIFVGGLAIHQYALVKDHHGVVPYKTIFSPSFNSDYADAPDDNQPDEDIFLEPGEAIQDTQPHDANTDDTFEKQPDETGSDGLMEVDLEDFLSN